MDEARAHRMASELTGKHVGGWVVEAYLGAGKSAVVLAASRDGVDGALKVFDPDIVEAYGESDQLQRIQRELELKGHTHPHLVQLLDGGKCATTNYLFIVMARITGRSLDKFVPHFPPGQIRKVISQIAGAARYLEDKGLAHRDIKPSNIALTDDFERATLLDMGVIRPIGASDITDEERNRPFIGTLRYASPEFLERKEEDSTGGWRAVSFYQLGGVLHDLIMRRPLFSDYEQPFTVLADAVRDTSPTISAGNVPHDLQALARNCLVKDWRVRESLVSWNSFFESPTSSGAADRTKEQLRKLIALPGATPPPPRLDIGARTAEIAAQLSSALRSSCTHEQLLPPHELKSRGDDNGSFRFMLLFGLSQKHQLLNRLSFHAIIHIEDAVSDAITIKCESAIARDPVESPPPRPTAIYRGVLDLSSALESLESALFAAVAKAMNHPPVANGEIIWLTEDAHE